MSRSASARRPKSVRVGRAVGAVGGVVGLGGMPAEPWRVAGTVGVEARRVGGSGFVVGGVGLRPAVVSGRGSAGA